MSTEQRIVLVEPNSRMRPTNVGRLCEWQYLERSILRMLAGWGRYMPGFYDKSAIHRFVWEQTECVQRLRDRLTQFPGDNVDSPVSRQLEELANTVLLAPTPADAWDGIFRLLTGGLVTAYSQYAGSAHGVHDAPTIAVLHELIGFKEQQRLWFRDYRRRNPHTTDRDYEERVSRALVACERLTVEEAAAPVGVKTDFRLPKKSHRDAVVDFRKDLWGWLMMDFPTDIEARRLFWCYGYLMEKNIPDDQLIWLWSASDMPWDYQRDLARHLWDESRHGDSGCSRLLDFGIALEEIGFPDYSDKGEDFLETMSPRELYDATFAIGMIAETAHFRVKQEAYQDFRDGGDLESAEMMLFDIIDENAHVQYAHKWLPVLAQRAGIDNSDYKERAQKMREEGQAGSLKNNAERARQPRNADYHFTRHLIERMRRIKPLTNAGTCPPRSPLP
ncbi:MAG: hypothetical protein WCS70_04450 [Verrucomicrobiota bacterium]